MGTVPSVSSVSNLGVAELMQTLSGSGVSLFSSPAMASALQSAQPQDVAELSVAAVQMQGMDQLFGIADGTSPTTGDYSAEMNNVLANLDTTAATTPSTIDATGGSGTNTASTNTSNTDSTASQLAQYQLYAQGAENQALLGGGSTVNMLI